MADVKSFPCNGPTVSEKRPFPENERQRGDAITQTHIDGILSEEMSFETFTPIWPYVNGKENE